jgi:hypothetical protein
MFFLMEKEDGKKKEELEEVKDLFRDGLGKIFRATLKVSKGIVESFKEGYSENSKEKNG